MTVISFREVWEGRWETSSFRQFRYFIAVAWLRRAASALDVGRSSRCQQVGKLERALEAQLLTRDRRRGVHSPKRGGRSWTTRD